MRRALSVLAAFALLVGWAALGAGSAPRPEVATAGENCGCKAGIRATRMQRIRDEESQAIGSKGYFSSPAGWMDNQ